MVLTILFPVWQATENGIEKTLYPLHFMIVEGGVKNSVYFPYALSAILAMAAATIAILEIGKFEDRMLQVKLGALNSLVMVGALCSLVYFATQLISIHQQPGEYGMALWLPFIAMVSNMIANRFIRRDEKLVRDADRIR